MKIVNYCKLNLLMTLSVRPSRSVGWFVGWSVCHNFLKGRKVSYRSTFKKEYINQVQTSSTQKVRIKPCRSDGTQKKKKQGYLDNAMWEKVRNLNNLIIKKNVYQCHLVPGEVHLCRTVLQDPGVPDIIRKRINIIMIENKLYLCGQLFHI